MGSALSYFLLTWTSGKCKCPTDLDMPGTGGCLRRAFGPRIANAGPFPMLLGQCNRGNQKQFNVPMDVLARRSPQKSCPACCAKAESGTHTGGKTEHLLRLLEACGAVASWRTRAILQNASGNACPPKHAESSRLTNLKGPCLGGRSLPGCLRTFVLKA